MSHKATNWLASLDPALLGHSEFRVLFHLCDCHNPSQGCFPTQHYLMTQAGASNGTVNNVLNSLERKGLIKRHRQFDGKTKKQKPTRYKLGFELPDGGEPPAEPTPENGDGNGPEPTPKIGDGPDSNLEGNPSPTERATRLQPTGEEPVSKPVNNQQAGADQGKLSEIAGFWISQIMAGRLVPQNGITSAIGREIRASGLLNNEQMKTAGLPS